jgi:hypothetical protein
MKKYFLLLISAVMMGTSVYAWEKYFRKDLLV